MFAAACLSARGRDAEQLPHAVIRARQLPVGRVYTVVHAEVTLAAQDSSTRAGVFAEAVRALFDKCSLARPHVWPCPSRDGLYLSFLPRCRHVDRRKLVQRKRPGRWLPARQMARTRGMLHREVPTDVMVPATVRSSNKSRQRGECLATRWRRRGRSEIDQDLVTSGVLDRKASGPANRKRAEAQQRAWWLVYLHAGEPLQPMPARNTAAEASGQRLCSRRVQGRDKRLRTKAIFYLLEQCKNRICSIAHVHSSS